jgi:hypothetical protein
VSISTAPWINDLPECPGGINVLDCRRKIANVFELSDCQFN